MLTFSYDRTLQLLLCRKVSHKLTTLIILSFLQKYNAIDIPFEKFNINEIGE
jgi:hypothetical protein